MVRKQILLLCETAVLIEACFENQQVWNVNDILGTQPY